MNVRILVFLRRFFNFLGWFSLAAVVYTTAEAVHFHFANPDPIAAEITHYLEASTPLVTRLGTLFDGVGNAYLAFFMGSVLLMLQLRRPQRVTQSERFLLITCACFVGKTLTLAISWSGAFPGFTSGFDGAFSLFTYLASAAIAVSPPLLYAATAYVLFSHFKQMVTFESEVA